MPEGITLARKRDGHRRQKATQTQEGCGLGGSLPHFYLGREESA
jgi:hypothetical protein